MDTNVVGSSSLEKPAMYRVLSNVSKYRVYDGLRHATSAAYIPYITKFNLNKQPLPKQPVPDLKQTAERYLKSLKPLLTDKEYENTERIVKEFVRDGGVGSQLHSKLLEKYQITDNWMKEWWLQVAYLGYRAPVIINSSPGTVAPPITLNGSDDVYILAARLIAGICDYNEIVKSGKMKQEMVHNILLDMQPYCMILGTHRQPDKKIDRLLHTDEAKHIIIINNNNFFKLYVVDENGILSEANLVAAMKDVVNRSQKPGKPIGILTGNNRDTWAEDYNLLLELGNNRNIIKDIETSLFILCLDKNIPKDAFKGKNNASVRAVQTMTGFNSYANAGNRWHDKTIQYIISADGYIGMEYEHSPCEGVPVAVLHDYVLKYISAKENNSRHENISKNFPRPEFLKFETNSAIDRAIEKATIVVDNLSNDIDMECFTFDKFGADAIKSIKLSPDSFIQIAMQVTFYKLHKKAPAHYESAALRRYINARTECIRSTSIESMEFAKIMFHDTGNKAQKKEMMIKAINAHKNVAGQAAIGQGCDRHLFGLKMIAQNEGMELPELYTDIGYIRSTYFNLTSSQVPYKSASFMCYGPVVPDGYGCCYNPRPKDILFACSSFKSNEITSSRDFAHVLQQTLFDMRAIGSE